MEFGSPLLTEDGSMDIRDIEALLRELRWPWADSLPADITYPLDSSTTVRLDEAIA